jgi:hypothetical protein
MGIVGAGTVLAFSAGPAAAEVPLPIELLLPISAQIAAAMNISLGVSSYCIRFTYDTNGNRTARTSGQVQASPVVWGSGTYGCFVWGQ